MDFTPNDVYVGFFPADPSEIWLLQGFPVIGPGETLSQTFDLPTQQGLGPFTLNDFQLPGDYSFGILTITYDYYAADPNGANFNPDDPNHQYGLTAWAGASAQIADPPAPAPEPTTIAMFAACVLLLFGRSLLRYGSSLTVAKPEV